MRYYKFIIDGYIMSIGTGDGGNEISESEYEEIMTVIKNKPQETDIIGYRLKADLTWESYEKEPQPEPEPDAEEIVNILTGEAE